MHLKRTFHTIDMLFTFLLLLAFLLFSLLLAETGAAVYRKATDSLNETYTTRTALSYVTEKLRQYDSAQSVRLAELDEIPALVLYAPQNGIPCQTYIYYYDGALRELFTRSSTKAEPAMGSAIVELSDFSFKKEEMAAADAGLLLSLHVTDVKGTEQSALIHLSSFQ